MNPNRALKKGAGYDQTKLTTHTTVTLFTPAGMEGFFEAGRPAVKGETAVAAKELGRFFVGAELEREFCELAGHRIKAAVRGSVLREISVMHGDE